MLIPICNQGNANENHNEILFQIHYIGKKFIYPNATFWQERKTTGTLLYC